MHKCVQFLEVQFLRTIAGYTSLNKKNDEKIQQKLNAVTILIIINKLKWCSHHMLRMSPENCKFQHTHTIHTQNEMEKSIKLQMPEQASWLTLEVNTKTKTVHLCLVSASHYVHKHTQ